MRFLRYGLGALAVVTACAAVEACTRHEPAPGVLMLAIQTDMSAGHGKAIQAVGLYVRDLDRGRPLYALTEPVAPDGTVRFPATLAIAGRANPGASIRIRVVGFKDNKAQVMRDAVTTIPTDRVALFRLPIRWVNYEKADGVQPDAPDAGATPPASLGTQGLHALADDDPLHDPFLVLNNKEDCSGERTFVDGTCVSWNVDSSALPDFVEGEVFGGGTADGGGTCFDTEVAFAESTPAEAAGDCLFRKPTTPFTLAVKQPLGKEGACVGDGCYIPLAPESDEGWKTDGPNARLSPGTCKRMAGKPLSIVFSTKLGSMSANATLCGEASVVGRGTDLPTDGLDGGPNEGGPGDAGDAGARIVRLAPGTGTAPTQLVQDATNLYYVTRGGSIWKVGKQQVTGQATRLVGGADAGAGIGADNYKLVVAGTPSRLVLSQTGSSTLTLLETNGNPVGTITLDAALTGGIAGSPQGVYAIVDPKGVLLKCLLPAPGSAVPTTCTTRTEALTNATMASFVAVDDAADAGDQYIATSGVPGQLGGVYKHSGTFPSNGTAASRIFNLLDPTAGPLVVEPGPTGNVFALVPSDGGAGSGLFANAKNNAAGLTNAITFVQDNLSNPTNEPQVTHEVYLHQKSVFWTNAKGDVNGAAAVLPTKVVPIAQGQATPMGITVDADFVYWTTMGDGQVWRAPRQNPDLP